MTGRIIGFVLHFPILWYSKIETVHIVIYEIVMLHTVCWSFFLTWYVKIIISNVWLDKTILHIYDLLEELKCLSNIVSLNYFTVSDWYILVTITFQEASIPVLTNG